MIAVRCLRHVRDLAWLGDGSQDGGAGSWRGCSGPPATPHPRESEEGLELLLRTPRLGDRTVDVDGAGLYPLCQIIEGVSSSSCRPRSTST